MAIYRNVQMSFWTDPDIIDDYTPDDKLFYLYTLTNPHTNLCGCYEISIGQMAYETGLSREEIEESVNRAETIHKTIVYSRKTKELLILNWSKYNWTESDKVRTVIAKEIKKVKEVSFRQYLSGLFDGVEVAYGIDRVSENSDTVSIGYRYPIQNGVYVSNNNTVNNNTNNNSTNNKELNIDNTVNINNKSSGDTNTLHINNNSIINNKLNKTESKKKKEYKEKENERYFPDDEELNQAFLDFMDMRKQIKKPMTEKAIGMAITKLQKLSSQSGIMDNDLAIDILNQSTMNSWLGLFPLSGNRITHRIKPSEDNDNRKTDNTVAPEDEELISDEEYERMMREQYGEDVYIQS